MAINVNSEAYCRKAYLNYHCYGNTMGLTAEDMGKITQAWESRISSWQATVSSDENEYEFDDSEYANYKEQGKEAAQKATGHDGSKESWVRVTGDFASGTAGALAGTAVGKGVANNIAHKIVDKTTEEVAEKALESAGEEAAKQAGTKVVTNFVTKAAQKAAIKEGTKKLGETALKEAGEKAAQKLGKEASKEAIEAATQKGMEEAAKEAGKEAGKKVTDAAANIGWIITAPLALATGIAYQANKPNKDQVEACNALQTEMDAAQVTLADTQGEMEVMSDEIISLSDEATTYNEDANSEIEGQKTEYDSYLATYNALKEKIDAGTPLTDSEKELYKAVVGYLTEIGVLMEETMADASDEVGELYDEIGSYQEGYDVAAESMGEVEGLTDFAEGFDDATRTMCYVEGAAQTLNAASGAKAAWGAGKFAASGGIFTAWAWGFAAMGAAGAAMSGVGAYQQFKWAGEVGTEIDMRKVTQDVNTDTMDIYTEEIDAYDGYMQGVEDLELEVPDDIAPPEDAPEIPTEEPTGEEAVPDVLKPKKEEPKDDTK